MANALLGPISLDTLRAVRAISMSRAKNSLPIVPRQFLSLSYPKDPAVLKIIRRIDSLSPY